jgi:hypothetical protein
MHPQTILGVSLHDLAGKDDSAFLDLDVSNEPRENDAAADQSLVLDRRGRHCLGLTWSGLPRAGADVVGSGSYRG